MDDWGDPWAADITAVTIKPLSASLPNADAVKLSSFPDDSGWGTVLEGNQSHDQPWSSPWAGPNESQVIHRSEFEHHENKHGDELVENPEDIVKQFVDQDAANRRSSPKFAVAAVGSSVESSPSLSDDGGSTSPKSPWADFKTQSKPRGVFISGTPALQEQLGLRPRSEDSNLEVSEVTKAKIHRQTTVQEEKAKKLKASLNFIEMDLMSDLFDDIPGMPQQPDEPDDSMVGSQSTSRTWYRISRSQTMRDCNREDHENSYVRVTWPGSAIHKSVLDVVSNWTGEGRVTRQESYEESDRFSWASTPGVFLDAEHSDIADVNVLPKSHLPHSANFSKSGEPLVRQGSLEAPSIRFAWSTAPQDHPSDSTDEEQSISRKPSYECLENGSDVQYEQSQISEETKSINRVGANPGPLATESLIPLLIPLPPQTDVRSLPSPLHPSMPITSEDNGEWGKVVESAPPVAPHIDVVSLDETEVSKLSKLNRVKWQSPQRRAPFNLVSSPSQGPQMPAPFFSELPQKAAVRTYLIKRAESTRHHKLFVPNGELLTADTPKVAKSSNMDLRIDSKVEDTTLTEHLSVNSTSACTKVGDASKTLGVRHVEQDVLAAQTPQLKDATLGEGEWLPKDLDIQAGECFLPGGVSTENIANEMALSLLSPEEYSAVDRTLSSMSSLTYMLK